MFHFELQAVMPNLQHNNNNKWKTEKNGAQIKYIIKQIYENWLKMEKKNEKGLTSKEWTK